MRLHRTMQQGQLKTIDVNPDKLEMKDDESRFIIGKPSTDDNYGIGASYDDGTSGPSESGIKFNKDGFIDIFAALENDVRRMSFGFLGGVSLPSLDEANEISLDGEQIMVSDKNNNVNKSSADNTTISNQGGYSNIIDAMGTTVEGPFEHF